MASGPTGSVRRVPSALVTTTRVRKLPTSDKSKALLDAKEHVTLPWTNFEEDDGKGPGGAYRLFNSNFSSLE